MGRSIISSLLHLREFSSVMVLTIISLTQTCTQFTSGTLGTNLMVIVNPLTPGSTLTAYLKNSNGSVVWTDTFTMSENLAFPFQLNIGFPVSLINDAQYTFEITSNTDGSVTSTFTAAKCNPPPCMTIDEITPTFNKLVSCGLINTHMRDSFIAMFTRILE